jgi:hypothetical protein
MHNTPLCMQAYECHDDEATIKRVYEVLEQIDDPFPKSIPTRRYWLIINTQGEIDLIYQAIGMYYQSAFVKDRW